MTSFIHSPKNLSTLAFEKVVLSLEEDAWHGYATETVWAEPIVDLTYRIQNVPFYAHGISYDDTVVVQRCEGQLVVSEIVGRGGHSTYRVFLGDGTTESRFFDAWCAFERCGCTYERATERLIAIDVPRAADISEVYGLLEQGEKAGVWDFQEGHCGHPVRAT